jgi:site-specific DNA-methyltransferase (adenine-specific)
MKPISEVYNCDCMEYMRGLPDNAFDLIIADPPYGIGEDGLSNHSRSTKNIPSTRYTPKSWDREPAKQEFFDEALRVGRYAIIWGANHFISRIPFDSHCWIVWDKDNGTNDFADCELAWTNLPSAVRKFHYKWHGMLQENMVNKEKRIHPTQKPVALYGWLLKTFLPKIGGGKVFDPMMGSQSSRIAAYKLGYDFCGCELDKEYFEKGCERFERECHGITKMQDGTTVRQLSLFDD